MLLHKVVQECNRIAKICASLSSHFDELVVPSVAYMALGVSGLTEAGHNPQP
ncbi:MAG: hypothetical protein KDI27_01585 [Gammaproteobacteria bacterium]|nr:hypothetical protein [Gammaproteobacteria bacterium]MCP5418283.1 hypothetical protein [Chromatiaceae bacterium]